MGRRMTYVQKREKTGGYYYTIVVPGGADADVIAVLAKVAKAVEVGKLDGQIEVARQKPRRAKVQG